MGLSARTLHSDLQPSLRILDLSWQSPSETMKSTILTALTLSVVMGSSLAKMRFKRGGDWDNNDMECKDPSEKYKKIVTMMCDDSICVETVPTCVSAMMPPGDVCAIMKECKSQVLSTFDDGELETMKIKKSPKMKMAMMECYVEEHMQQLGLVYSPKSMKANCVAVMEETISRTNEISDDTKNDLLTAMYGECAMPDGEFNMMDKAMFMICM